MKQLVSVLVIAFAAIAAKAFVYTPADVPSPNVADRNSYVANPDGILSAEVVERIDRRLAQVRRQSTVEVAVVAVDSIDGYDPTDFATELFNLWHPGKTDKDNGLIILLVTSERAAVIRPGYGLEGVLPDAVCDLILRRSMIPSFRSGDYSAGIEAGVDAATDIILNPENADELRSDLPDSYAEGDDDGFSIYLRFSVLAAAVMLIIVSVRLWSTRKLDGSARYEALDGLYTWSVIIAFATLGMGLPALAILWLMRRRVRTRRNCPNCGTAMHKFDEVTDNQYLTPAQDLEEQLGSVDYDVWQCPGCGELDVIPFVNKASNLTKCPACGARAMRLTAARVVKQPTSRSAGLKVLEYECLNCHHRHRDDVRLEPEDSGAGLAAAAVAASILSRSMRGGGGGFSGGGGGFSGGNTGGGGATGNW